MQLKVLVFDCSLENGHPGALGNSKRDLHFHEQSYVGSHLHKARNRMSSHFKESLSGLIKIERRQA